jgi:hypothetical protein
MNDVDYRTLRLTYQHTQQSQPFTVRHCGTCTITHQAVDRQDTSALAQTQQHHYGRCGDTSSTMRWHQLRTHLVPQERALSRQPRAHPQQTARPPVRASWHVLPYSGQSRGRFDPLPFTISSPIWPSSARCRLLPALCSPALASSCRSPLLPAGLLSTSSAPITVSACRPLLPACSLPRSLCLSTSLTFLRPSSCTLLRAGLLTRLPSSRHSPLLESPPLPDSALRPSSWRPSAPLPSPFSKPGWRRCPPCAPVSPAAWPSARRWAGCPLGLCPFSRLSGAEGDLCGLCLVPTPCPCTCVPALL